MKRSKSVTPSRSGSAVARNLAPLVEQVRGLVQSARSAAAASVNSLQVRTNFEIGRLIVRHEQQGAERAAYGKQLLKELAARLTLEFGRGYSERNLEYMRKFFLTWKERMPQISQKASAKLPSVTIWQKPSAKLALEQKSQKPSDQSPFTLSWSHYVLLLTIKNPEERSFYEIEATGPVSGFGGRCRAGA